MSDDVNLLRRRARRRLVGAIALVVLAVVVLPIILDQKPRPGPQELTVQIPSQDGSPFKKLPPLQPPPATQKGDAPAAKAPEPAPAEPATAVPAKSDIARTQDKPRAKPKTAQAFVFQLGVFANADNAKQVRERAAAVGVKSYTEHLKGQEGEQTRVRAGPFPSRGAAEKARDKLKSLGMDVGQVAQR